MMFPLLLMLAAMIFAVCSGPLDRTFQGGGKLRYVILVCSAGVFLISLIGVLARLHAL